MQADVLALLIAAFGLGLVFNAAPGPVFAETVRRGVGGGFRPALAVQLGSLAGDALWAVLGLTGVGLILQLDALRAPIGVAGVLYLLWLAWDAWVASSREFIVDEPGRMDGRDEALRSGVLLSLTNPQNVAYWAALGSALGAVGVSHPVWSDYAIFFAGFMASSVAWAFAFAALVHQVLGGAGQRWARLTYRACAIAFLALALASLRDLWAQRAALAVPGPLRSLFMTGLIALAAVTGLRSQAPALPDTPLRFGAFSARFAADGSVTISGDRWPTFQGTWVLEQGEVVLRTPVATQGCDGPGRYRAAVEAGTVRFALVEDACTPRRMILDRSTWRPAAAPEPVPERRIVRSGPDTPPRLPQAANARGSWPSFRGPGASGVADGQRLPERWNVQSGENVLWRVAVPGLAHSSPIVWGDRVFVTTAVSSDPKATFRPGLYGDGDASADRSRHRWMLMAFDKRTGARLWERVAYEGVPNEKRHIKSTYASATPATDGRIVVASFGSQGVYAYDVEGRLLWKVDLGRLDVGAYDIPSFEWGPASSPILWDGLVILQCDTQADSFLIALDAATGKTVWKTERDEGPSWGTPTVAQTTGGAELVTNASSFIRGYDPKSGRELWRLGGSSKITAPTPIYADGLFVVASGRAPERPVFVVEAGARGDLTLPDGETARGAVRWSRTGRGPYMPTPLAYRGLLYVLGNNGVFDAYDLKTGREIYRQRLPHLGSGFSSSPVAADGRIYLSNEDGEMLVVAAGPEFAHVATNAMPELLMATPALSDGVMYVRSVSSLFAIGEKRDTELRDHGHAEARRR